LLLDRYKTNVILVGEDVENTILTYDDYAGKAGGTSMSYSVELTPTISPP
jgi:pectinesterase